VKSQKLKSISDASANQDAEYKKLEEMLVENNKYSTYPDEGRFSITKIFNPITEKLKEKRERQNETRTN